MAKIKIALTGFDELLFEIQRAQGDIKKVVNDCMEKEVQITYDALIEECVKSGVPRDIIGAIEKQPVKWEHDRATAAVGWEMGEYDPRNPSHGYKAVFLNYGTPKRATAKGYNRGKITPHGFIKRAKSHAKKRATAEHKKALNEILKDLKK